MPPKKTSENKRLLVMPFSYFLRHTPLSLRVFWVALTCLLMFETIEFGFVPHSSPHISLDSRFSAYAQTTDQRKKIEKRSTPKQKTKRMGQRLRKSELPAEKIQSKSEDSDHDDMILNGIKIGVGVLLTIFLMFQLSERNSRNDVSQPPLTPATKNIQPKALVLGAQGVDPATQEQSALIKVLSIKDQWKSKFNSIPRPLSKISLFKADSSVDEASRDPFAEAVSLFGPDDPEENKAIGREISALTYLARDLGSPGFKSKPRVKIDQKALADNQQFPENLANHFELQKKEKLLWHQTYFQGSNEGTMAVTNQRILHVYHKQVFRFFPPGFNLTIERNQHPLLSLRTVRKRKTRKNFFLIAAAPFLVWFPYGTLFSLILIAIYAGWTREELAIGISPQRLKTYPLPPQAQAQFLEVLRRVKKRKKRPGKGIHSQHAS